MGEKLHLTWYFLKKKEEEYLELKQDVEELDSIRKEKVSNVRQ